MTAYILLVGIGGVLLLYTNSMNSSVNAWDTTIATSHAENILEEMQLKSSLADIQTTPWQEWIDNQQILTLPQEEIDVNFKDSTVNLLDIEVIVSWQRSSRINQVTLQTTLTK